MRSTEGGVPKRQQEYPFEKLEIWRLAQGIILSTYGVARRLPRDELFGLVGQLRRAAVSVALNIAEGRAADSDAEFRRFLGISERSLVEVIACLRVCVTLGYVTSAKADALSADCDVLQAKIRSFRRRLGEGKRSREEA